jgi:hypothetical protein
MLLCWYSCLVACCCVGTVALLHVAVLVQLPCSLNIRCEVGCDHCECVRAEKDDFTPRPVILVSPEKPGADMLSIASAAFSSAHAVLKTMPEHEGLAKKCLSHAIQLYDEAKANPGIYSDSEPILAKTYKNDQWEQFAYLASAWLYEAAGNEVYLEVLGHCSWQCQNCFTKMLGPTAGSFFLCVDSFFVLSNASTHPCNEIGSILSQSWRSARLLEGDGCVGIKGLGSKG